MSTTPAPAKLWVLFPKVGCRATILRSGPRRWAQLIAWNLETDDFEPGQWLKGKISFASISPDGRHIAYEVMGGKSRVHSWQDTQYVGVSSTPYFTAHYFLAGGLCFTHAVFTQDGKLMVGGGEWRAPNECPYERAAFDRSEYDQQPSGHSCSGYVPEHSWTTSSGRRILSKDGRLLEQLGEQEKLLLDANLYQPEQIEAPEWALRW